MATAKNRLTANQIKGLIAKGEAFDIADGDGLWLRLREGASVPVFRFRYRYAGKARVLVLGEHGDKSLAAARATATGFRGDLANKRDPAQGAKEREQATRAADAASRNVYTVSKLAAAFYERKIKGKTKHPQIVLARITKHIDPVIGRVDLKELKNSTDVRHMLDEVNARGFYHHCKRCAAHRSADFQRGRQRRLARIQPGECIR